LSPNTTYYWHVRAVAGTDTVYTDGSPTAFWSFTTGSAPGAFSKVAPPDDATGQLANPILSWTQSSGASTYWYCYDTSNDNACYFWVNNGSATSVTLSGLAPHTRYYWHVMAVNGNGATFSNGSPTAYWNFRTGSAPAVYKVFLPLVIH
jgi:hypothetical protein